MGVCIYLLHLPSLYPDPIAWPYIILTNNALSTQDTELPPERLAEIRDVFSMFDKDDSGDIDSSELKVSTPQWD